MSLDKKIIGRKDIGLKDVDKVTLDEVMSDEKSVHAEPLLSKLTRVSLYFKNT